MTTKILAIHDERFSKYDVIINPEAFPGISGGDVIEIIHPLRNPSNNRLFLQVAFIERELYQKQPQLQISLQHNIALLFDLQPRMNVYVEKVEANKIAAEYVELSFKDQYLGRGDMFRLRNFLSDSCVYLGKKIIFSGCIRCKIREIYSNKTQISSGFINENTKIIFRSESAKYFIFLQISQEMFELDTSTGETFYEKAVDGFLPSLFSRWKDLGTNHVVSIVLFSRVIYTQEEFEVKKMIKNPCVLESSDFNFYYSDFFKVVVDWETRTDWTSVIPNLKQDTLLFCKNILEYEEDVVGNLAPSKQGNILEAVNLALNIFDKHYIDRDLLRTGLSIVTISPAFGLLEAPKNLIRLTTERMIEDGIGLDWVCLRTPPLFSVPVFKFKEKGIKDVIKTQSNESLRQKASSFGWRDLRKTDIAEALFVDTPVLSEAPEDSWLFTIPHWVDISFYPTMRKERYLKFMPRCSPIKLIAGNEGPFNVGVPNLEFSKLDAEFIENYDKNVFSIPTNEDEAIAKNELTISSWTNSKKYKKAVPAVGKLQSLLSQKIHAYNSSNHTISAPASKLSKSYTELEAADHFLNDANFPLSDNSNSRKSGDLINSELSSNNSSVEEEASPVFISHLQGPQVISGTGPISIKTKESALSNNQSFIDRTTYMKNESPKKSTVTIEGPTPIIRLSVDPCRPKDILVRMSGHLRRWHHVFPQMNKKRTSLVKWNSLCTPACLPLTTDYFPTIDELSEFQEYTYTVSLNEDTTGEDVPALKTDQLLMELVSQRLVQGFQAVVSVSNSFSAFSLLQYWKSRTSSSDSSTLYPPPAVAKVIASNQSSAPLYLVMGRQVHRLTYDPNVQNVEVKRYVKKIEYSTESIEYKCLMWPRNMNTFIERTAVLSYPFTINYNWNYLDHVVAGYQEELTDTLKFWRARFLLIPSGSMPQLSVLRHPQNETLTDEEIRLAGFNRFVELFQKANFFAKSQLDDSSKAQNSQAKVLKPLPIIFTTFNISTFVRNEYEGQQNQTQSVRPQQSRAQTFSDSARLNRESKLSQIAAMMLNPICGIQMKDKRWHLRFYERVFVGSEYVDWLLKNFVDIDTREDAVEFGDYLMKNNLIEHVNRVHRFLDGHYFYRLSKEYLISSSSDRGITRWFSRSASSMKNDNGANEDEYALNLKEVNPNSNQKIELSHKLIIDVDPQRKSDRREVAILHYETVHNPKNCYHFHLHWIVCTSRLVEDLLQNWSRLAEKYGLKMVEGPVEQESDNPFQSPILITPVVQPSTIDRARFPLKSATIPYDYFETELVKSFGFILDVESDDKIDSDKVSYSYARSKYQNTQFVHNSGVAFIQIRAKQKEFYWVNNRLFSSHSSSLNLPHPDDLCSNFQKFCSNPSTLEKFWKEAADKLFSTQGLVSIFEDMTDEVAKLDEQLIVNSESPAPISRQEERFRSISIVSNDSEEEKKDDQQAIIQSDDDSKSNERIGTHSRNKTLPGSMILK